jgi:regulator of sigma E protease
MLSSIIVFLIVLSVLILVHELGHYLFARKSGILVEEFGFGLPPRIFGKKIGETVWSINLLPFGGFVRLHGENLDEDLKYPARAFLNKSAKVRILVVSAGVLMNFLLGILAFSVTYSIVGIPRDTGVVKVISVAQGSPAEEVGLKAGDVITSIDGLQVQTNSEFISIVEKNRGKEVVVGYIGGDTGKQTEIKVVPRKDPPKGEGALGVVISSSEIYFPPIWQRPFLGAYYGVRDALYWTKVIFGGVVTLVFEAGRGTIPKDVAGPVGIYVLTSQAVSIGFLALLNFVGILSINLAILNILPIPALDGGRLLFILIEKLFGRRVLPRVENAIHTIGIFVLITLIFAITIRDIQKLVSYGGIKGYIDSVLK